MTRTQPGSKSPDHFLFRIFRRKLLIVFFLFASLTGRSQDFFAYIDSMRFLYTFDDGYIRRLDERPIGDFKFGNNRVAFNVPYDDLFKISIGTGSTVLFNDSINDFWFSRNMLVYLTPNYLNCFWEGRSRKLEFKAESYKFNDSIVAWVDRFYNMKVFFNGSITEIDNRKPQHYKVSENLVAWQSINGIFKIWWNDSVYEVDQYEVSDYSVGMNICAFTNNQGVFRIFHKGKFVSLENLGAIKFMIADDMVAWSNPKNELWIFYNGEAQMLEQYSPQHVGIADKLFYWSQPNQYFRVFDKGNVVELESYMPGFISIFDSRLCYTDLRRHLKVYEGGFSSDLSKEQVRDYYINGNVIAYFGTGNDLVICHKNKKTRVPIGVRAPWGR